VTTSDQDRGAGGAGHIEAETAATVVAPPGRSPR
jgi:hypothetical protein